MSSWELFLLIVAIILSIPLSGVFVYMVFKMATWGILKAKQQFKQQEDDHKENRNGYTA